MRYTLPSERASIEGSRFDGCGDLEFSLPGTRRELEEALMEALRLLAQQHEQSNKDVQ